MHLLYTAKVYSFFIFLENEIYLVSKVKAKRGVSRATGNNLDGTRWNNSKRLLAVNYCFKASMFPDVLDTPLVKIEIT